uniref:Uncharacterized protein n=1 Tax=Anguilla anguilla TaxID=7936 RepID=A0A0E9RMR7_ANGAN
MAVFQCGKYPLVGRICKGQSHVTPGRQRPKRVSCQTCQDNTASSSF